MALLMVSGRAPSLASVACASWAAIANRESRACCELSWPSAMNLVLASLRRAGRLSPACVRPSYCSRRQFERMRGTLCHTVSRGRYTVGKPKMHCHPGPQRHAREDGDRAALDATAPDGMWQMWGIPPVDAGSVIVGQAETWACSSHEGTRQVLTCLPP
ncbi:hypothetical protein FKP32DRAFT_1043820 [Trametes sanguinea]|nr:hypothetical protein FKP32DRAFT_1043820 [Trametes sanguinea]